MDAYIQNQEEGVFEGPPVTLNSSDRVDTDWEKFHKDAFTRKTEEDKEPMESLNREPTLVLDESALAEMERAGFPRSYAVHKLNG